LLPSLPTLSPTLPEKLSFFLGIVEDGKAYY